MSEESSAAAAARADAELPEVLGGFDLSDQSQFAAGFPHKLFARLRREAPILWHPPGRTRDGEGFWVLSRYADVRAAAADERLSAKGGGGRAGGGTHVDDLETGVHAGILINMIDNPRHGLFRDLVSPPVARQAVERRLPRMRELAARLVGAAVESGGCDFQPDVSAPFAIEAIALTLGAPEEDWPQLVEWAQDVAGLDNRKTGQIDDEASKIMYSIYLYSQKLLALKRAGEPTDELMSVVARGDLAEGHGEPPLSEYERAAFFCLVLLAGSEPPRNTMAGGVLALAQHPEQWQALRADRSLLPGAIEEMLRWTSPTPYNRRTATEALRLGDTEIAAGEKVTFWWASANRDETVFTDPDTFDIRRNPNPHLAFGDGMHSCLGTQLARIELRLLLEELLDRVAEIRLTGPVDWAPTNKHTVMLHMPVELVPVDGSVTGK